MLNLSRRALHIRRFSPTCPSPAMFPAISYGSGGSLPSVSPPARQVSFIATSHASFRNPALNNVSSEEDALFGEPQLPREQVTRRIIEVVKSFEKVSAPDLVKETTHFVKDLGLDSLDVVELILLLEDEFMIDIPDEDAVRIVTVTDAIEYLTLHPSAL